MLALFIPLIISSGGNSGSQAATLVIARHGAAARCACATGCACSPRRPSWASRSGLVLGSLGLIRILFWPGGADSFGEHYLRLGAAVSSSILAVVLWGTLSGSMMPFALRRLGADPASASAPMVATVSDLMGLLIYFNVTRLWLA